MDRRDHARDAICATATQASEHNPLEFIKHQIATAEDPKLRHILEEYMAAWGLQEAALQMGMRWDARKSGFIPFYSF